MYMIECRHLISCKDCEFILRMQKKCPLCRRFSDYADLKTTKKVRRGSIKKWIDFYMSYNITKISLNVEFYWMKIDWRDINLTVHCQINTDLLSLLEFRFDRMMYNQDQISITIPDKVIRSIHLIMLYLCVVATIALFVIESQPCKIMLSILLCSYGIFLMVNPQIFKLVFQINDNKRLIIASKDYLIPPKRRLQ